MSEKEKTAAEIATEKIRNMKPHRDYVPVENMPIPLYKDVLIKKTKQGEIKTKSGIILGGMGAENVIEPNEGIIMAVGPMCSEFVKLGLKYKFSQRMDSWYVHEGEEYIMADEAALRFIVPSDDFVAHGGYKTAEQIRRGKKLNEQKEREIRLNRRDANEKDQRNDNTKGKTRKMK